jgi:hypothetical protein
VWGGGGGVVKGGGGRGGGRCDGRAKAGVMQKVPDILQQGGTQRSSTGSPATHECSSGG